MRSVTITLPYPVSANVYWRTRVVHPRGGKAIAMTYISPEAKAFKEEVGWLAKAAGVTSPIKGRVELNLKLYPRRPQDYAKRQRDQGAIWDNSVQCLDLDNCQKVVIDSLKDIVFEDDKFIWRIHAERMEPDGEARVIVTITEILTEQLQQSLLEVA